MHKAPGNLFRFGDFELDVDAYELRRGGQAVRVEQQPMDLLILLVERRPQLVTRAEIVERLWGSATFVEADAGINTAVRKVRLALGDSAASPSFIERIPGKGYRFAAPVVAGSHDETGPVPARRGHALLTLGVTALLVALAAGGGFLMSRSRSPAGPALVVPLTRLTGVEREPTLSPDGSQAAFAWNSEREDNFDIYVALVGDSGTRRLTDDPAPDLSPQWSPEGSRIAYVRVQSAGAWHQLRVMSALGAADHAVSDFPAWYQSSWSPDGKYLASGRAVLPGVAPENNGIYLVPVDGGDARALTHPVSGNDYSPAFSPDGRRLAYASCQDATFKFDCDVNVVDLDERWQSVRTPRRLTREKARRISGITWSRDGESVIYGAGLSTSHLWRVSADGAAAPEPIAEAGDGAAYPSSSRSSDRMAFSRMSSPNSVYRFEQGRPSVVVAQSSGGDVQPSFSPNGRMFAFCSSRSGTVEIWIAGADGSSPRQLTHGQGREQCSPAWSPNGGRIAFDSVGADGTVQIWTIALDGSQARRLTRPPDNCYVPTWSRDGQWIYCSSVRNGLRNIWRVRVETGAMQQLTTNGSGHIALESMDERDILYTPSNGDSPLLSQSKTGGSTRTIIPCVARGGSLAVGSQGIYYLACGRESDATSQAVHLFEPGTGTDRAVGVLESYYRPFDYYTSNFRKLTVSRDGAILYMRRRPALGDLMLIESAR